MAWYKALFERECKHAYYLCFGLVRTLTPKIEMAAGIGTLLTQYFSFLTEFDDFCLQMIFLNISGTLVKFWSQGVH